MLSALPEQRRPLVRWTADTVRPPFEGAGVKSQLSAYCGPVVGFVRYATKAGSGSDGAARAPGRSAAPAAVGRRAVTAITIETVLIRDLIESTPF
ncbi:hypothetical protein [Kitasatospora cineracea]|uniref:hypothetical protein n=1 Tax=Kitasatospora cineracea TaxID=88074 RepID=UPI003791A082